GGRVDQQKVEAGARAADDGLQPLPLLRGQRGQRLNAGAGRNDADVERAVDDDVLELLFTRQEVSQVQRRRQAEHDVDVAKAEVRVQNPHAVAEPGERRRQVDDDVGFADAALAAGNRD